MQRCSERRAVALGLPCGSDQSLDRFIEVRRAGKFQSFVLAFLSVRINEVIVQVLKSRKDSFSPFSKRESCDGVEGLVSGKRRPIALGGSAQKRQTMRCVC